MQGGGRSGGTGKNDANGPRKGSNSRGGGDGDGDLSDVTQGSRDEDDTADRSDSPVQRPNHKSTKPTSSGHSGPAGSSNKNADSFYSVPEVEEYGSDNSGQSDKAYSPPTARSATNFSYNSISERAGKEDMDAKKVGGDKKEAQQDDYEEDEYSLDDFENDGAQSPEKAAVSKSATDSSTAVPMKITSRTPPPTAPLSSPSQRTITPTNAASSATKAAAVSMNSVEEIMQRWYTADTDFMQRSLQRISSGETGFALDDDDVSISYGSCTILSNIRNFFYCYS